MRHLLLDKSRNIDRYGPDRVTPLATNNTWWSQVWVVGCPTKAYHSYIPKLLHVVGCQPPSDSPWFWLRLGCIKLNALAQDLGSQWRHTDLWGRPWGCWGFQSRAMIEHPILAEEGDLSSFFLKAQTISHGLLNTKDTVYKVKRIEFDICEWPPKWSEFLITFRAWASGEKTKPLFTRAD